MDKRKKIDKENEKSFPKLPVPNKELGQNFLIDSRVLKKETSYGKVNKNDTILEIGAGTGNFTRLIAKKAKKVIAIEKDKRLIPNLERLKKEFNNIELIEADFLNQRNIPLFNKSISNLPYKTALPIIFKLLEKNFEIAILICQERLAKRMAAKTNQKGYCRIGIQIQRLSNVQIMERVPKNSFYPKPNVDNMIIKLEKRDSPPKIPSERVFRDVLKYMFFQTNREKKIKKNIDSLKYRGVSKKKISRIMSKLNKKILDKKVFQTNPGQFVKITNILGEELNEKDINKLNVDYTKKTKKNN